ncbi:MAG: NUDIX hydrolase [Desulfobacteraceae bacterium IS3]|nr:MAG: NUDIX hydrolase [Desulfobacteraceae bacterium IS3]HAO23318.1 NUDIX hydrolase [Desulfobacteraceae bacterium]
MSCKSVYPDAPRPAVGAVVFKNNEVLLVKRGKPPAEGSWAIPGGSVRLGESLQAAAEREIREETGVIIQAGEPIFVFDTIERDDAGQVRFHYIVIDLIAEYVSGEPVPGDDAADARWISAADMDTLEVNIRTRGLLNKFFNEK